MAYRVTTVCHMTGKTITKVFTKGQEARELFNSFDMALYMFVVIGKRELDGYGDEKFTPMACRQSAAASQLPPRF